MLCPSCQVQDSILLHGIDQRAKTLSLKYRGPRGQGEQHLQPVASASCPVPGGGAAIVGQSLGCRAPGILPLVVAPGPSSPRDTGASGWLSSGSSSLATKRSFWVSRDGSELCSCTPQPLGTPLQNRLLLSARSGSQRVLWGPQNSEALISVL